MGERDLAPVQAFVGCAVRARAPIADASDLAATAESLLVPSARGMTSAERLEVYREQYWLRHLKNLADDYPTLAWAIGGRDAFEVLAAEYLEAHPPRTWDLQKLGADLPGLVASHPRWSRVELAHDAARLDWAFMEAFDAPDAPPFEPRVLASIPEDAWPRVCIGLHPAFRALALGHPLHDAREALQRGETPATPQKSTTPTIVWRDARCFLRAVAVDAVAFELLTTLLEGAPLGEACEEVARSSGLEASDLGSRIGAWFQDWTQRGWVSTVRL